VLAARDVLLDRAVDAVDAGGLLFELAADRRIGGPFQISSKLWWWKLPRVGRRWPARSIPVRAQRKKILATAGALSHVNVDWVIEWFR
jgi:hypothetical protein